MSYSPAAHARVVETEVGPRGRVNGGVMATIRVNVRVLARGRARARVRVMATVRVNVRLWLRLELGFGFGIELQSSCARSSCAGRGRP